MKTLVVSPSAPGDTITLALIVFSALTTRASRKRPLNPLAEAVVVADRQRRRHALAEVERVRRRRSGPSAPGSPPRQPRAPPATPRRPSRLTTTSPNSAASGERALARPFAGLRSPGHRLLVARAPRAHPHLVPQLHELARDPLPDHPGSQHTEPHPLRTLLPRSRHRQSHPGSHPVHPRRHHFRDAQITPAMPDHAPKPRATAQLPAIPRAAASSISPAPFQPRPPQAERKARRPFADHRFAPTNLQCGASGRSCAPLPRGAAGGGQVRPPQLRSQSKLQPRRGGALRVEARTTAGAVADGGE